MTNARKTRNLKWFVIENTTDCQKIFTDARDEYQKAFDDLVELGDKAGLI